MNTKTNNLDEIVTRQLEQVSSEIGVFQENAKGDGYNPYRDTKGRFDDGLTLVELKKMRPKVSKEDKKEVDEAISKKEEAEKEYERAIDELSIVNDKLYTIEEKMRQVNQMAMSEGLANRKRFDQYAEIVSSYADDFNAVLPEQHALVDKVDELAQKVHGTKSGFRKREPMEMKK